MSAKTKKAKRVRALRQRMEKLKEAPVRKAAQAVDTTRRSLSTMEEERRSLHHAALRGNDDDASDGPAMDARELAWTSRVLARSRDASRSLKGRLQQEQQALGDAEMALFEARRATRMADRAFDRLAQEDHRRREKVEATLGDEAGAALARRQSASKRRRRKEQLATETQAATKKRIEDAPPASDAKEAPKVGESEAKEKNKE